MGGVGVEWQVDMVIENVQRVLHLREIEISLEYPQTQGPLRKAI